MKTLLLLLVVLYVFALNHSFASDTEKESKIARIFAAQELTDQIQDQLDAMKGEEFIRIATRLFSNSLSTHPKSNKITKEKTGEILARFVKNSLDGLTAKTVLKGAVEVYGEELTLEDVNSILSYYQSAAGMKDVAATQKVTTLIGVSMIQIVNDQLMGQIPELISELDKAVVE